MIFPAKAIRAGVVARHVRAAGMAGAVCFSCGNAAAALRAAGLDVIEVGPGPAADFRPDRWWTAAEIARAWPDRLDATSGHLSPPLMAEVADAIRDHLGPLCHAAYSVPTGSGETAVCLAMAYPATRFVAVYDGGDATRYEPLAPLNALVARLCEVRRATSPATAGRGTAPGPPALIRRCG